MTKFQLFRVKLYIQQNLFNREIDRSALLRRVFMSKPSAELREGYTWHIGNIEQLDDNSAYFALGRTTRSMIEMYDNQSRDFVLGEYPESPYTHAFIDYRLQVVAIAYKPRLAPYTSTIAKQLEKLLNQQQDIRQAESTACVVPLKDPKDFLEHLQNATSVNKYWAEVSLPNPFDSHADWEQPFQNLLRAAKGQKGKTVLQGENLDRPVLEEITRAAAVAGNDVSARMKDSPRGIFRTRRLRSVAVFLDYDEDDETDTKPGFIGAVRETYENIRDANPEP
jgi:hypothetical protein